MCGVLLGWHPLSATAAIEHRPCSCTKLHQTHLAVLLRDKGCLDAVQLSLPNIYIYIYIYIYNMLYCQYILAPCSAPPPQSRPRCRTARPTARPGAANCPRWTPWGKQVTARAFCSGREFRTEPPRPRAGNSNMKTSICVKIYRRLIHEARADVAQARCAYCIGYNI
jgi:hypothetical protein